MAEILPMPSNDERIWRMLDEMLAQGLAKAGLGTEAQRLILADLHRRLADFPWQANIELPPEIHPEMAQEIRKRVGTTLKAAVVPLFGAMILMATEMYVSGTLPSPGADSGSN